ncbi:hypothetical protein B5F09_06770 [Erysipelatoclostridium sp. An173]|uniref:hypothetical protein n=1 Tax=Erysipelatoclostridium sp. An173 TaxID=1965571 RepID=UPI000B37DE95|nr:hypothetical protein [Erysipelatoclostridium sp. An173]OUP77256.1 hypothetical protein B5F09_06770 [Erysipelatoclostridium sp. An173]
MKKSNIKSFLKIFICISLLANLFFAIRLVQVEKNYNSNISAKQEEINELKKDKKRLESNNDTLLDDNDIFKEQYKKYFELCEELENQMGVYYE